MYFCLICICVCVCVYTAMHVICRTCGGQRVTLWSSRNRTQVQELKSGSQAGSKSLCLLSYMLAYLLFLQLGRAVFIFN